MPALMSMVFVVGVAIAIVKPWGPTGQTTADRPLPPIPPPRPSAAAAVVAEATSGRPDPEAAHRSTCPAGGGWWIVWRSSTTAPDRSGIPALAVDATGIDDPRLRFIDVGAEGASELGICAPLLGPDRPSSSDRVSVWSVPLEGRPRELEVRLLEPAVRTNLVAIYAPPRVPGKADTPLDPNGWGAGRYVFLVGDRWLGVEILGADERVAQSRGGSRSMS